MNIYQLLEAILEELADGRQKGESIADYKKRKGAELEKLYNDREDKATMIADNASKRADKLKGRFKKTRDLKDVEKTFDLYQKATDKRSEASKAQDKALRAAIIRMNTIMKNEALELMEAIINEVSVKRWKEAAANSLDKRKEAADATAKYAEQSWDTYEEGSRKHPEEEDALYRRAWRDDIIAKKAEEKEDHAHDVLSVKAKGKSANKAIKAARASQDKRDKEYMQNSNPEKFDKLRVRTMKADQLVSADPVKSRANEALEIMEEIISEVSDEKAQKALDAARQRYDRENYEASMKLFKGDKKGAEEDGEKSAEKFNKHLNLQLKRAERKSEKLVQDKDDHDYFRISNEALELMEEILKVVDEENLYDHIVKLSPKLTIKRFNKLTDRNKAKEKEVKAAAERELGDDSQENINKIYDKRYWTKSTKGEDKTRSNQTKYADGIRRKKAPVETVEASIARHNVKKAKANEALELMEQICDFADNLFELDYEEKQNISPNKIKKVRKDKDGEKVEVVSVADELFPYEGDAKQQFNQKVLAKINDMIEGTGSLEDLIQFVRKGVAMKKQAAHETLTEEKKEPNKECEYRKAKWEEAVQKYFDVKKKHLDWESQHPETKKAYDEERKAYADLDKARRDSKKIYGPYEALEILEDLIKGLVSEEANWEPAKYKNKWHVYDKTSCTYNAVKGGKKGAEKTAKELNTAYPDCKAEIDPFYETLQEIKDIADSIYERKNIFGHEEGDRGDLLDDADTTLGSPVKKKIADIKAKVLSPEQKKVN